MTETTEEIIARLAKDRAKTILENSDFWSGPGSANTSATAITALVALSASLAKPAAIEESPAAVVKGKRADKAKEQAAATAEANDADPADA